MPDPVEFEHLSTRIGYTKTPTRTTRMQTSFPQTLSDRVCRTSVPLLQQLSEWLLARDLGGEGAGCGGPGLVPLDARLNSLKHLW